MVSGDEGWHLLVTALSYQVLPLAAGTLIQLHTLDPGQTVTREVGIHSPPPVSKPVSEPTHLLAWLPRIEPSRCQPVMDCCLGSRPLLLLVTSSEQRLSWPVHFVSSLAADDFSTAFPSQQRTLHQPQISFSRSRRRGCCSLSPHHLHIFPHHLDLSIFKKGNNLRGHFIPKKVPQEKFKDGLLFRDQ